VTADPVSWLLIEPGWRVVTADDEDAGRVEAVLGDSGADIFDGLAVASGVLARPRYVPAEHVAEITEGSVRLSLDAAALTGLGEYEEPPASIDVEGDAASRTARVEDALRHPDVREHREGIVHRVLAWFGLVGRR
jgi:hypothetical protein